MLGVEVEVLLDGGGAGVEEVLEGGAETDGPIAAFLGEDVVAEAVRTTGRSGCGGPVLKGTGIGFAVNGANMGLEVGGVDMEGPTAELAA
jgi:hypothetical protein